MGADEEYVRARWELVHDSDYGVDIVIGFGMGRQRFCGLHDRWVSARAFTEQREEEIRQLEAQAAWLKPYIRSIKLAIDSAYELRAPDNLADDQRECEIVLGILARTEAALAEKKRGMKQPPEQGRGEGR